MLEFANEHPFLFLVGLLCGTTIALTVVGVLKEILLKILAYPLNLMQWANIHKHGWPTVVDSSMVKIPVGGLHDADLEPDDEPESPPAKREYRA